MHSLRCRGSLKFARRSRALGMKIRPATPTDVPQLVTLNRAVQAMHAVALPARFRSDAPDEVVSRAFTEMLELRSACWLIAEENEPVGFLSAEFRDGEESWCQRPHRVCYLAGIAVAPGSRRKGVARALINELRRETAQRGVREIELDVWAFNTEARAVFARLGFRPLTERLELPIGLPAREPT